MGSPKQKRAELERRRINRMRRADLKERAAAAAIAPPKDAVMVTREALAPANSYGTPDFVQRGYYVDTPFTCVDCGSEQIWTGAQQKFWYEVAKGYIYSTAKRCLACRRARKPKPIAE